MKDRLSRLAAFYRSLPAPLVDGALGMLVFLEGSIEMLTTDASAAAQAWAVGIVAGMGVAYALRRRAPLLSVITGASMIVAVGVLPTEATDTLGGPWFAFMWLLFSFGLHAEGRRLWVGGAAVAGGVALSMAIDQWEEAATDYGFVLVTLAPIAIGHALSSRAALNRALREKAQRAEAERVRSVEAAAADERTRVAGELHDVVAHALGAMTVQASAARRLAERGNSDAAREAFHAVEETGRDALGELRRLLGVLRREDEEIALAPQPQLAFLPDLVRRMGLAGLPVDLSVEGEPPASLPAGLDLTGYRLVQEALREALAAGEAGRARVRVRYAEGHVDIEVADDGRSEAPRKLLGMRERVRVYGGSLRSVPVRPRGHRLESRLPLEPAS